MAAYPSSALDLIHSGNLGSPAASVEIAKPLEFAGVFPGRELTRKDRRLSSGLVPIDHLLGGGIVRGRISEIVGAASAGKTSLAARFIAAATRRGETAAWIDSAGTLDPATVAAAGADLSRVLWTRLRIDRSAFRPRPAPDDPDRWNPARRARRPGSNAVHAAEIILEAGGFGLVVIDFGTATRPIAPAAALRIARIAERTGAAVLVLASSRMCGTFAAQSLTLVRNRACFSRHGFGAPALFDGFEVEARMARNKLGGTGASARWRAMVESHPVIDECN